MAAFAEFRILWSMTMTVGSPKLLSPAEIRQFLKASEGIDFAATERSGLYRWIEQTLQRYRYSGQSKEARGVLREFLVKMTGWSVPQVTRLIGQYLRTGQVREKEYGRHRFARQYRPGYIRIDTVHQPERDGEKSVYHINAIDAVTQWEVLGCVPTISEHDLIPALKAMLQQFPFRLRGFHSDNGSEYVNDPTASLLEKLPAEFTKSRPRRSNHNALVETKNGAVVPKNIGYQWLPPSHADDVDVFYQEWFNPYLHYHRPCGFATVTTDAKGKIKKVYDLYVTPYERLKAFPKAKRRLKPGLSFAALDRVAKAASDTEFARQMQKAKQERFRLCAQAGAGWPVPLRAPAGDPPAPVQPASVEGTGRRSGGSQSCIDG